MSNLSDLTAQCIRCGFCLESCPTYSETGHEAESPRGRIYLVRSAIEGDLSWEDAVKPHLDGCLGCRACETACPSGVKYGEILELAREELEKRKPERIKRTLLNGLTDRRKMRTQLALAKLWPGSRLPGVISRLLSGERAEADLPVKQDSITWPPLEFMPPVKGQVYLLEGCVMSVLYPEVHLATRRLLRRVGYEILESDLGCCGALHAHNGYLAEAIKRIEELDKATPASIPIIVNSAGCGSWMKDSGIQGRAYDATEFLLKAGLANVLSQASRTEAKVTYHDACHLAHGQKIRDEPRQLLQSIPGITLIPLNEADTCCGSAGIYNLLQPKLARRLLERKWNNIAQTGASIVATGNPGCHAWIAQAAKENGAEIKALHTLEVLERAISGLAF